VLWSVFIGCHCQGKLMLPFSSTIIENIEAMCKTEGALMGYFYFDLRHNLKQILLNMVSSLLMQLSTRSKLCCDALARLHSAHDGGADTPRGAVLTDCLKQILSRASQTPVYLILDALDGCSNTSGMPSPREEVLRLVKKKYASQIYAFAPSAVSKSIFELSLSL
jgi:hypothetical protein